MLYSDYITKSITSPNILNGDGKFQGNIVLNYSISYPNIELNQRLMPKTFINDSYRRFAQNAKRYIMNTYFSKACRLFSSMDKDSFSPLEIMCEMSVMYENRGFLSVFFDTYEKLGDIVLKTMRHSDTWSLSIGKILPIGSFFESGYNFKQAILNEISCQIEAEIQDDGDKYFKDWQKILRSRLDLRNYYLADDGLVIYFQEYSISPKKSGLPSFLIPYVNFGSSLKYDL